MPSRVRRYIERANQVGTQPMSSVEHDPSLGLCRGATCRRRRVDESGALSAWPLRSIGAPRDQDEISTDRTRDLTSHTCRTVRPIQLT